MSSVAALNSSDCISVGQAALVKVLSVPLVALLGRVDRADAVVVDRVALQAVQRDGVVGDVAGPGDVPSAYAVVSPNDDLGAGRLVGGPRHAAVEPAPGVAATLGAEMTGAVRSGGV